VYLISCDFYPPDQSIANVIRNRELADSVKKCSPIDEFLNQKRGNKGSILLAKRDQLARSQVMCLEA